MVPALNMFHVKLGPDVASTSIRSRYKISTERVGAKTLPVSASDRALEDSEGIRCNPRELRSIDYFAKPRATRTEPDGTRCRTTVF